MGSKVEEEVMTPKQKIYDLRLGDMVWTEPHGAACLLGAVDGSGNTFIVAVEKDDKVLYTIITQESIMAKMDVPPRLTRVKNASFGTDILAQKGVT